MCVCVRESSRAVKEGFALLSLHTPCNPAGPIPSNRTENGQQKYRAPVMGFGSQCEIALGISGCGCFALSREDLRRSDLGPVPLL